MAPTDAVARPTNDSYHLQLLQRITAAYPHLSIATARLHTAEGQFNDILIVNEALIFRFPRSPHVAATLAAETALLTGLQGHLPLPIPNPIYQARDPQTGALQFMGYPLLPGQPLWRAAFDAIADDQVLDHLAAQLAGFLRALHTLPPAALGAAVPVGDTVDARADMLRQFQAQLYSFMRPDAREDVTQLFTMLLDDLRHNPIRPAPRHGDFGTGNILYDPQAPTITGIIDFGFGGVGDPTLDVAALAASYGEAFIARCATSYPAMAQMLPRARLYEGTYALQQALYALRDGNAGDFADGIAAYV
ncbi:MAG: phosphotransferase family protein [Roseiflexaceae bacterium]